MLMGFVYLLLPFQNVYCKVISVLYDRPGTHSFEPAFVQFPPIIINGCWLPL